MRTAVCISYMLYKLKKCRKQKCYTAFFGTVDGQVDGLIMQIGEATL